MHYLLSQNSQKWQLRAKFMFFLISTFSFSSRFQNFFSQLDPPWPLKGVSTVGVLHKGYPILGQASLGKLDITFVKYARERMKIGSVHSSRGIDFFQMFPFLFLFWKIMPNTICFVSRNIQKHLKKRKVGSYYWQFLPQLKATLKAKVLLKEKRGESHSVVW